MNLSIILILIQKILLMFKRNISSVLEQAVDKFPVTVLTGPRQSGKTTLLKYLFTDCHYVSLESPDTLLQFQSDPRGMLQRYCSGLIIDEAQKYPEIFSYIQEIVDDSSKSCRIILSGSQNFLMAERISQTLAGRAAIFELLPLSYQEYCSNTEITPEKDIWSFLLTGSYPRPYQEGLPIKLWYDSYIRTYIERDVRSLINVKDLSKFQLFLKFCAGQHGQEFNASVIATSLGLSQTTIMNWLSILEASYIVFRLQPYYRNFKKRLSKRSKLYFYDTAIVCHLLGIESADHLAIHSARGALFEGFVISEFIKNFTHSSQRPGLYYWREHSGHEVDLIIERGEKVNLFEIKSTSTLSKDFCKGLDRLSTILPEDNNSMIIYAGDTNTTLNDYQVTSWKELDKLV